jgi:hypothetical protein
MICEVSSGTCIKLCCYFYDRYILPGEGIFIFTYILLLLVFASDLFQNTAVENVYNISVILRFLVVIEVTLHHLITAEH